MIELLFLIRLWCDIGGIARRSGRTAIGYQLLVVTLWFAGETIGWLAGGMLSVLIGGNTPATVVLMPYLMALCGAAIGAVIAFRIAKSFAPPTIPSAFPVIMVDKPASAQHGSEIQ